MLRWWIAQPALADKKRERTGDKKSVTASLRTKNLMLVRQAEAVLSDAWQAGAASLLSARLAGSGSLGLGRCEPRPRFMQASCEHSNNGNSLLVMEFLRKMGYGNP